MKCGALIRLRVFHRVPVGENVGDKSFRVKVKFVYLAVFLKAVHERPVSMQIPQENLRCMLRERHGACGALLHCCVFLLLCLVKSDLPALV